MHYAKEFKVRFHHSYCKFCKTLPHNNIRLHTYLCFKNNTLDSKGLHYFFMQRKQINGLKESTDNATHKSRNGCINHYYTADRQLWRKSAVHKTLYLMTHHLQHNQIKNFHNHIYEYIYCISVHHVSIRIEHWTADVYNVSKKDSWHFWLLNKYCQIFIISGSNIPK